MFGIKTKSEKTPLKKEILLKSVEQSLVHWPGKLLVQLGSLLVV